MLMFKMNTVSSKAKLKLTQRYNRLAGYQRGRGWSEGEMGEKGQI